MWREDVGSIGPRRLIRPLHQDISTVPHSVLILQSGSCFLLTSYVAGWIGSQASAGLKVPPSSGNLSTRNWNNKNSDYRSKNRLWVISVPWREIWHSYPKILRLLSSQGLSRKEQRCNIVGVNPNGTVSHPSRKLSVPETLRNSIKSTQAYRMAQGPLWPLSTLFHWKWRARWFCNKLCFLHYSLVSHLTSFGRDHRNPRDRRRAETLLKISFEVAMCFL